MSGRARVCAQVGNYAGGGMPDQWMTYQQAGEALGVSAEALRRYARRQGWRVQRGNDGKALVLVPEQAGTKRARPGVQRVERTSGQVSGQVPGDQGELLSELRRRAESAEARADVEAAARKEVEVLARVQAGQIAELRQDLGGAQREVQILRGIVTHERAQVAAERQRAEAVQVERDAARAELADWTSGGPLARAWRALVYRRGRP